VIDAPAAAPFHPVAKGIQSMLFLRSLLFFLGLSLTTVCWGMVVLLCFPLSFERRYRVAQQWSRFVIWWLHCTCKIDYQVTGLENLPTIPTVLIAKHQSSWETIFLHQFLPPLAWVVKKELLYTPFFGWALASLHPIAIHRQSPTSALKQVLRQGGDCLAQGRWVLIFPEGTRMAPGERGTYAAGGALLATKNSAHLLPVALNSGCFWPRRGFIKRPGTIQLVFGPLLSTSGRKPKELTGIAEKWIESTVQRLDQMPLRADQPDTRPETS
jgi:1-acyl-sn-glycerol-3-phosphate acyltransferase